MSPEASNRAHRWFVAYVAALVVLYLLMAAGGVFLLLFDFGLTAAEVDELRFQGGALVIVGIAFAIVYGVGLFLPRKQWGWVYGLVLLGLGMTSCCTWPATIPLLIAWLKPEMKARFGMT